MDAQQALKTIMNAAERALLPKIDHLSVEQAYQVVLKALQPEKEVKEATPAQE